MVVRIPFSNVVGKQKTKNRSGNWNSVFQSRKKTKNENGKWNSVFKSCKKTKNENRTLNFVFQCCRKTEHKNKSCISFFHAIEKRLALRYTHCLTCSKQLSVLTYLKRSKVYPAEGTLDDILTSGALMFRPNFHTFHMHTVTTSISVRDKFT